MASQLTQRHAPSSSGSTSSKVRFPLLGRGTNCRRGSTRMQNVHTLGGRARGRPARAPDAAGGEEAMGGRSMGWRRAPAPASPRAPARRDPRSRPRRPAPCCLPARTRAVCRGSNPPRARRGWPAHRRWDGASRTPRRPLAAGFGAVRASQAGGGTSCGVQCCASGMQWMWCSPRAVRFGPRLPKPARSDHGRARSRRTGRPWAAWARVLCAEQQLQLVGARGAAPHSPPRGAPVASCCVRVRARTEGARGARWAWAGCGVAGTESEERRRKTRCSSAPRAYST